MYAGDLRRATRSARDSAAPRCQAAEVSARNKPEIRNPNSEIALMHVCLFDIDGTLIHTRGAGMAALREGMREAFGIAEPTDRVAVHGRTDRGITRDFFRHHGVDDSPEHWEQFREAYLRVLPETLAARPGTVLPG